MISAPLLFPLAKKKERNLYYAYMKGPEKKKTKKYGFPEGFLGKGFFLFFVFLVVVKVEGRKEGCSCLVFFLLFFFQILVLCIHGWGVYIYRYYIMSINNPPLTPRHPPDMTWHDIDD